MVAGRDEDPGVEGRQAVTLREAVEIVCRCAEAQANGSGNAQAIIEAVAKVRAELGKDPRPSIETINRSTPSLSRDTL